MSYMERIRRTEASLRHGKLCHEGVTRKGEFEPCDKPAVALRDDCEADAYYPVCKHHARGFVIPLVDPDDAAALVETIKSVLFICEAAEGPTIHFGDYTPTRPANPTVRTAVLRDAIEKGLA